MGFLATVVVFHLDFCHYRFFFSVYLNLFNHIIHEWNLISFYRNIKQIHIPNSSQGMTLIQSGANLYSSHGSTTLLSSASTSATSCFNHWCEATLWNTHNRPLHSERPSWACIVELLLCGPNAGTSNPTVLSAMSRVHVWPILFWLSICFQFLCLFSATAASFSQPVLHLPCFIYIYISV